MNSTVLHKRFSTALIWNGLFYFLYKSCFFLRTALLYYFLTPTDFSTWANLNSALFLLLLWLDCGFRKSIPRFAPQAGAIRVQWLSKLAMFQIAILFLSLPLLYVSITRLTTNKSLIAIVLGIFIAEGIHALIKLFYHAYFHNKTFNSIAAITTTTEMILILLLLMKGGESQTLLIGVMASKLFATVLLVASSWKLYTKQSPLVLTKQTINTRSFIAHSAAMWSSSILNSLTERNVLIPIITYGMGIEVANICKLANDGALYIYRIVIKTIGSADTALLAHIEEGYEDKQDRQTAMANAIEKLTTQVSRLVLPLLGVVGIIMVSSYWLSYEQYVFHAFFIMAVGYLAETMWLPYERLLEVKQSYRLLFLSYVPYLLFIFILFYFLYISCIGLLPFLLLLHSVRLVTGFSMRMHVYREFHI